LGITLGRTVNGRAKVLYVRFKIRAEPGHRPEVRVGAKGLDPGVRPTVEPAGKLPWQQFALL